MNLVAAGAMELLGIRRPRSRDVGTGIVLCRVPWARRAVPVLGHDLDLTNNGATFSVLFGSIFTLCRPRSSRTSSASECSLSAWSGALLWRPLLLTSLNPDLAAARGVSGAPHRRWLAPARSRSAVSLSAITIGAILSTALLIGPAATALRIAKSSYGTRSRSPSASAWRRRGSRSCSPTTAAAWSAQRQGWPVSFCVVAVVFVVYLLASLATASSSEPEAMLRPAPVGRGGPLMFAGFMINAWEAATIVAVVAGVVGFFTVLRGSAFAAHALPNGAFAGAAGASLIGVNAPGRPRRLLAGRGAHHRRAGAAGHAPTWPPH